jgi:hypothetical protein
MSLKTTIATAAPEPSFLVYPSARRAATVIAATCAVAGMLIFTIGLFKHISYPLMWADESMTAVGAQRVLQFGYPKVHDGRNVFYDLRHSNPTLGIDAGTDAYIGGAGWGQYYFAAPFVVLSKSLDDLYAQTAALRVPFACAGLAGILLLLWTGTRSLPDRLSRLAVAALFVVLLLPSVTLQLHLREVRYYSLQLLLTALALSVFTAFHFRAAISFRVYLVAVVCLVPLLFLTFSPAALGFSVSVGLYLAGEWVVERFGGKRADHSTLLKFRAVWPLMAGLVVVAPMAWFFRTATISGQLAEFYGFSFATYLEHLGVVFGYFARYDVLLFAVAAKILLAFACRSLAAHEHLRTVLKVSLFLTLYCIVHALLIGKIPNRLFTRYFITLQPLLVLTSALDLLLLSHYALNLQLRRRTAAITLVVVLLVGNIGWAYSRNLFFIKERFHAIINQYRGVLDFVIPYLNENYADPSKLVIATNYEETSYIYYLGSRVIVGFLNPETLLNPAKVMQERPDCVLYRSFWADPMARSMLMEFVARDKYVRISSPITNYGFNNIPEVVHWTPRAGWNLGLHLFRTWYTDDPQKRLNFFVRNSADNAIDVQPRN